MKKRILLLAAFVASALGMKAQTDVTDTYLVNPSFEILKAADGQTEIAAKNNLENGLYGWEVPSMSNYAVESEESGSNSGFLAQDGGPIAPSDGTYYYFNRQGWGNKDSELKTTTKAAVEAGKYYLVFDYKAADYSNNNNAGNNGTTIGITVKDAAGTTLGVINAIKRAFSMANNGSNPQNNPYMQTAPWTQLGVYFEVETASVLTFAVQQNMRNNGRSDIIYDNFKLYKIDGAENVNVTGLIANPSFEAGNINGWTAPTGSDTGAKENSNSTYTMEGTDGNYLFNTWGGLSTYSVAQTLSRLPKGKYQLSAVVASDANNVITLSAGTASQNQTTTEKTKGFAVTVDFDYSGGDVEIKASSSTWLKADNFQLTFLREFTNAELTAAIKVQLQTLIGDVEAIDVETNVGDGVFQIPASAVTALQSAISDAQGVYDSEDATVEIVQQAIDDLNAAVEAYKNAKLNEPGADTRYTLILTDEGFNHKGKAVEFVKGGQTEAQGLYAIQYNHAYNPNWSLQHFYFEAAEGVNMYKIWFTDNDGAKRYICDGTVTGAGTGAFGIRTTTTAEQALAVKVIVGDVEGITYLWNPKAGDGQYIGSNGDNGMYTDPKYTHFSIVEAAPASVEVNIAAGKYATRIFPFVPELEGVTFYSCESVNKETSELMLDKVESPKANTPYVLYAENDVEETLTGYGTATTLDPVTEGLLVGSFESIDIEAGNYVLQTNPETGVQAFYIVGESGFKSTEYRAYLVKSADIKGRDAFFFGEGEATGINGIEQGMNESMVIYNLQGQRVAMPTRGIYIVNGKKVMVK